MTQKREQFEVRTKKAIVHIFDTLPLAEKWLAKQKEQFPCWGNSLKIYKTTTITTIETTMEAM